MKRMLLLATAGLVAAAMMVAMSAPAFAATTCKTSSDGLTFTCSGGERVTQPGGIATGVAGGQGGHSVYECGLPEGCVDTLSGGGGFNTEVEGAGVDAEGGGGGHCVVPSSGTIECTGTLGMET